MTQIENKSIPKLRKAPSCLFHTVERFLTRTVPGNHLSLNLLPPTRSSLPAIVSKVWATSESRLENSARSSKRTKKTRSLNGMMTVVSDSTNRRSRRSSLQSDGTQSAKSGADPAAPTSPPSPPSSRKARRRPQPVP
jgi:hypothetical protein